MQSLTVAQGSEEESGKQWSDTCKARPVQCPGWQFLWLLLNRQLLINYN